MSGGTFDSASFFAERVAPTFDPRLAARASDPVTSHEAARAAEKLVSDQGARVLEGLRRAGGKAGASHIGWIIGMEPYTVRKRLPELEREPLCLVRRLEETGMTRSGRREQLWELVA